MNLNVRAVSLAEGVRAGLAVAMTVLAGAALGLPHFGLAALGALLTCFADPGGPVRRRAPAVLAFAFLAGTAYGFFSWLRGYGVIIAAPVAGLAIFVACYARVYGQGGLQVGNLLGVVIVLALDYPSGSMLATAAQGANVFAGALWAALLTLLIWQIHPYQPARRALADVARRLADLTRDLAELGQPGQDGSAFAAHAALHRRRSREAIEAARAVALDTFRRRGVVSWRAAQVTVRLQTLEQIFGGLIALSDVLENNEAMRRDAVRIIRLLAGWLAALGPEIEAGTSLDTPKKHASLERLRGEIDMLPPMGEATRIFMAMAEQLAVLMTVSAPAGQAMAGGTEMPWLASMLRPPRQNFNLGSAPLRHALRAAVIAAPTLAVTMSLHQQFAHWTTITMILCLQPYFSATWQRAGERIAGTALGGALAAGIGLMAQNQIALALIMLPLTMFAFAIRGVSYGAFVAALTPMVVLLVEQIAPGTSEMNVAFARIGYTLLGGLLAVAGNLALWPGFEHIRLEASVSQALAAHAAYVRAVFDALASGQVVPDAPRRAAGVASNNLEASLARALLEPHRGRDRVIEQAAVADAALRRIAGRLAVLALNRPAIAEEMRPGWQAWQAFLTAKLAGAEAARPDLPAGEVAEALTRLARQAELISV